MSKCPSQEKFVLITLPNECQTNILSFLRAFELTSVQQTCRYYNDPQRIHTVIGYFVDHVYGPDLAKGSTLLENKMMMINNRTSSTVGSGPSSSYSSRKGKSNKGGTHHHKADAPSTAGTASAGTAIATTTVLYTLEDLRTIELNVVARVLSLPEPKSGFYVSKAWIKKTLLWLEKVNEPPSAVEHTSSSSSNSKSSRKLTKKQQRQRNRRLSDVSPPWPNANSDILCEHQNLQHCGAKAGRSRRKLMDKHAWKVRNPQDKSDIKSTKYGRLGNGCSRHHISQSSHSIDVSCHQYSLRVRFSSLLF
jgi:hypothetical protein